MVYNPPVEVGEDGEPIKDGGVALTHPVNPMRRGAYVEQATRATGWAVMYVLGWLLMRLSCYAGLPNDCNTPSEPLEVLTVLLVLLVFSLAQVREREREPDARQVYTQQRTEITPCDGFIPGLLKNAHRSIASWAFVLLCLLLFSIHVLWIERAILRSLSPSIRQRPGHATLH